MADVEDSGSVGGLGAEAAGLGGAVVLGASIVCPRPETIRAALEVTAVAGSGLELAVGGGGRAAFLDCQ